MPNLPYDAQRDFVPVARLTSVSLLLVATPKTGFKTAGGFIAHAKAHPGKLSYATGGIGTPSQLAMEMLRGVAGIDLLAVPYRAARPRSTTWPRAGGCDDRRRRARWSGRQAGPAGRHRRSLPGLPRHADAGRSRPARLSLRVLAWRVRARARPRPWSTRWPPRSPRRRATKACAGNSRNRASRWTPAPARRSPASWTNSASRSRRWRANAAAPGAVSPRAAPVQTWPACAGGGAAVSGSRSRPVMRLSASHCCDQKPRP